MSNQHLSAAPDEESLVHKIGLHEFVAPLTVQLKNPIQQPAVEKEKDQLTPGQPIVLFDPASPPVNLNFYLEGWSKNSYVYLPADSVKSAALEIKHLTQPKKRNGGLEIYIGDLLNHTEDLTAYHYLVITISAVHKLPLTVSMISGQANSYSYLSTVNGETKEIRIPLSDFKPSPLLLLPRPYPGFQPLYFNAESSRSFHLRDIEKFQLSYELKENTEEKITINMIRLEK